MILYYTERSPFARKVRMVAAHHRLDKDIQLVSSMPTERQPELIKVNPLSKIPVLVLPHGRTIVDSPVIARYIDYIGHRTSLFPDKTEDQIYIMHLEALADGIMDSAVLMMMESWRPEGCIWPGQFEKQSENIRNTLTSLEQQTDFFNLPLSMAHLSLGAAIDYITHRLPSIGLNEDWLKDSPQLSAWFSHFVMTELMERTSPRDGW